MSNFVDLFNEEKSYDKLPKSKDKSEKDKCKDKADCKVKECNESFHFGPSFKSNYLDYALNECEDNTSIADLEYHDDDYEDPTEPSVDDVVNAEPDIAANYHFGPSFGQDIFSKSTLKHSRK